MLKFDVITDTTTDGAKSGMFLHLHGDNKVFDCKLCQVADEDLYVCLVEVVRDGDPCWVTAGGAYYGIDDIENGKAVFRPLQYAIDDMLDEHPEYHSTRGSEEGFRPFKNIAELYSVYAKEKGWTLQVDLQGDIVNLTTLAAIPVYYRNMDEDCIQRIESWAGYGVNGMTWQDFFDHCKLVTLYDFRTNNYATIPCGILEKN